MRILGDPDCQIRVYPQQKRIEALVRDDTSLPSVRHLKFISARRVEEGAQSWNAVGATWVHSPFEAYLFACDVIDRVQLMKEPLATATEVVLQSIGTLIRRQTALSREAEIGLFGELLVLNELLNDLSARDALVAWRGPESEEHDFTLDSTDLEVKTTSSEERAHWITSLQQLTPVPGRQLRLVSIQLSPKAGTGSMALPDLVQIVERRCQQHAADLMDKLEEIGYSSSDADLYATEWALRTPVMCFRVDDSFPKITPADMTGLGLSPSQVTEVRYRVNLTGQQEDPSCALSTVKVPSRVQD